MTTYNPASRAPESTPHGPSQHTWKVVGLLEGHSELFKAAEGWVHGEYRDVGEDDYVLRPRNDTFNGHLPVALGIFTTFVAGKLPSNGRREYAERIRLSDERMTRLQGFVLDLDVAPEQIFLTRQTRLPRLVAASFMIARAQVSSFDAIRNEKDITPGTSGLRHTQDGKAYIGIPIATLPYDRELWPAKPKRLEEIDPSIRLRGGYIKPVPAPTIPQQRTHR